MQVFLEPGVKQYHWIEFDHPISGASEFRANFVEMSDSNVANIDGLVNYTLDYTTVYPAPTPTPVPPGIVETLPINQTVDSEK